MTAPSLAGRRVVIVGASSGIGAALALASLHRGARVVASARRADRLDELVAGHEHGHGIAADATDPAAVRTLFDQAVAELGGVDLVVYVAGVGILQRLAETDPEAWHQAFAVNVIGANLVAATALDHLDADGAVAFISSRTIEDVNAYFSMYASTKAAMDQCIKHWRVEHPDRRFIRVTMGNVFPTEFSNHMGDLLGEALGRWGEQGIKTIEETMETEAVGHALADAFAAVLDHPEIASSELRFDARPPR